MFTQRQKIHLFYIFGFVSIITWTFFQIQPHINNGKVLGIFQNIFSAFVKESEEVFIPESLSLTKVWRENEWIATLSAQKKTEIIVTGDVMLGRMINYTTTQNNDYIWPVKNIKDTLKSADITLINLENPIIENCPRTQTGMIFCAQSENIESLIESGIDVASIANNHIHNYGTKGITETQTLLMNNGIDVLGSRDTQPVIIEHNTIRFGFLAYNDVGYTPQSIAEATLETIQNDIREAEKQADVVIIMFHWGVEYTHQPNTRQKELAHFSIDNGADLVLGNHPHWYQAVEMYDGKMIMYSHGNTIFDQMWSQNTKEGVVGNYIFYEDKLVDVEFLPLGIKDYGQAYWLEGEEREEVLGKLREESERFQKK